MGMKGATSNNSCIWCKIHKSERYTYHPLTTENGELQFVKFNLMKAKQTITQLQKQMCMIYNIRQFTWYISLV